MDIQNRIEATTLSLLDYCRKNNWAGFDPYDALNSCVFARTPFSKSRICRIAATQILKRLPINLRPLLLIAKEQNPKAIALFLMSFVKLSKLGFPETRDLIGTMLDILVTLRSRNTPYWCWGYSFPWQGRVILVPKGSPNLVCTVFVANALLDAYEHTKEERCLGMAVSAAEYILSELYWTEGDTIAGFSYPLPGFKTRVHNANFLGAAFFCRIYRHTSDEKFLGPAMTVARYSAEKQHDDGSWDYGEHAKQSWVDNFHTGYNLSALRAIGQNAAIPEFGPHVQLGYTFYRNNFFREDGAPKYFHNHVYPLDIHSVAQSIITLTEFKDLDESSANLALSVFDWAIENMWDEKGFFYYRILPYMKNKISYMRWSQAWMLLALSSLLEYCKQETTKEGSVADWRDDSVGLMIGDSVIKNCSFSSQNFTPL